MTDTPPLQPHNPNLLRQLAAEESRERAQRTAGTFHYAGPKFTWMGPEVCVWCDHSVSAHVSGQCWTVDGVEANDSDCPCTMTNLGSDE